MKKIKESKIKKTVMNVMTSNIWTVLQELQNNSNVLEVKYEPEYSYTLCRKKITKEAIGYKLVVKYKE